MKFALAFLAVFAVCGNFLTAGSVPVSADKTIKEHLEDFLALLPAEQIKDLIYEYLASDEDFAIVLDYLVGDEFKAEVISVEGAAEFKDFLNYLESIGIKAYLWVNKFNEILGIESIAPLRMSSRITGGMPGFFKDLKALIPVDEIKNLYNEKLANYPEFAELVENLGSEKCFSLFYKLLANPNLKELLEKAKSRDIDVNAILDFIGAIFGFKFPPLPVSLASKGLVQELEDFIDLLPLDKFEDLFYEYLAEDEDFAIVLDYLMDEEFKNQLASIESTNEFKAQLNFFEKFGLPAYEYVNIVNAFLGIDLITPQRHGISSRITGGLTGFLKDIKALLPVEAIKKLYQEKLETVPEFALFATALQSQDYFVLVDQLLANKDIQDLIGKAEAKGVDFGAIIDFIASIFGLQRH